MDYSLQIVPVGFEYKRILAGLKYRPSNMVYLLESHIEAKNEYDQQLVKISQDFTQKLVTHFEEARTYEVRKKICSFIDYKTIIVNLCEIFAEIFALEDQDHTIKEISINLGTATKLFVSAAMFLSSFFVEKVKLFYINAKQYTINLLLNENYSKEEISDKYQKEGNTYSDEDLTQYVFAEVPLIKAEICPENAQRIILALHHFSQDKEKPWIKLKDILDKMGETDDQGTKMKFRYHFKYLLDRGIIQQDKAKRLRTYRFTDSGEVLAIIMSTLQPYIPTK